MNDENRQRAHQTLADEAERLQTQINEFIGRATMARVELPGPLYDANAELLLPARLREAAMHRAQFAEARGMPRPDEEAGGGDSGCRADDQPLELAM